jgi:hypothetical protein
MKEGGICLICFYILENLTYLIWYQLVLKYSNLYHKIKDCL